MKNSNNKIQIVAFSTNDTYETPKDIVNIFLGKTAHCTLYKSRHSIGFSLGLPESTSPPSVMICSIVNVRRDYTGISDVNCYLLFVDLEKEDSNKKFEEILFYMKTCCDETKKVFIFGMSIGDNKVTQVITQKDICNKFNSLGKKYEFKCVNIEKTKEIADYFFQILTYCNKHQRIKDEDEETEIDKDAANSGSCLVF